MTVYHHLANAHLSGLPVYEPGRPIEEVARELKLNPRTMIKLASNENPLGPGKKALAAIQAALPELALYPDGSGFDTPAWRDNLRQQ